MALIVCIIDESNQSMRLSYLKFSASRVIWKIIQKKAYKTINQLHFIG